VKNGDTLQKIARAYSTTPDQLRQLNPGISPRRPLTTDARIVVPRPAAHLYLDNAALKGGPQPFIVRGYAMVPFRKIVEGKHGVVIWIPKTREINAWANKTFMGLTIGSRTARINSDTYQLPVAADIRESRTMVPLRYIATAMNLHVEYNAATGTYYLISRANQ
jgi:LysM repeat protein